MNKFATIFKLAFMNKLAFDAADFKKLDVIERNLTKRQQKIQKVRDKVDKALSPGMHEDYSDYLYRKEEIKNLLAMDETEKLNLLKLKAEEITKKIQDESMSDPELAPMLDDVFRLATEGRSDTAWGTLGGLGGIGSGIGATYAYPHKLKTLLLGLGALGGLGYGYSRISRGDEKYQAAARLTEKYMQKARAKAMKKTSELIKALV